jgi:uncharacterized protein YpuA (DUF1002 family)
MAEKEEQKLLVWVHDRYDYQVITDENVELYQEHMKQKQKAQLWLRIQNQIKKLQDG